MTKTIKPRFVLEKELHAANERIKQLEANSLLQRYMHAGLSCPIEQPDYRPRAASESGLFAFNKLAPVLSFGKTEKVDNVITADDTGTPEWDVQDPKSAWVDGRLPKAPVEEEKEEDDWTRPWRAAPQEAEPTGVEHEPAAAWRDEPTTDWRDEPAADSGVKPAAYWADEHLPIRRTRSVPTWLPSILPPLEYEETTAREYEDLTDSEYDDYHTDGEREGPNDPEAEGPTDPETEETVDPEPEHSGTLEESLEYARNASDWCQECARYIGASDRESPVSLAKRSRLDDDFFYQDCRTCGGSTSTICYTPYKVQSALGIAQEVVWNAWRRHFPEWLNETYPEHPSEVRFGRTELDSALNSLTRHQTKLSLGCPPEGVDVYGMVDLRNTVAHQNRLDSRWIDGYLRRVQALAIQVGDEPRTMKLRRLRDELQRISDHALAEIKALEPLAALPYSAPWAIHHQKTLERACEIYDEYQYGSRRYRGLQYSGYPAFVIRAALHWRTRASRIGITGPDYMQRVYDAMDKRPAVLNTAPSIAAHSQPYFGDWREDLRRWFVVTKMKEKKPCGDTFHSFMDLGIDVLFEEARPTNDDEVANRPRWPVWPGSVDTTNAPALDGWGAPILPAPVDTANVPALDGWGAPILPEPADPTDVTGTEGDDTETSTEPDAPDARIGGTDTADSTELSAPEVEGANTADDAKADASEVGIDDSANITQPDAPKVEGRADSTKPDAPEVGADEIADSTELGALAIDGTNPGNDTQPDAPELGGDATADITQPGIPNVEGGALGTEVDIQETPADEIADNREPDVLEVFLIWTLLVDLFILTIQSCMYR
ncbi:hypothetical protein LTS09_006120 [Friedmanniomyces endolithicus]|nr:hypothetical protein LTS09_006120 [Friedmanniomyces endolithicus]